MRRFPRGHILLERAGMCIRFVAWFVRELHRECVLCAIASEMQHVSPWNFEVCKSSEDTSRLFHSCSSISGDNSVFDMVRFETDLFDVIHSLERHKICTRSRHQKMNQSQQIGSTVDNQIRPNILVLVCTTCGLQVSLLL